MAGQRGCQLKIARQQQSQQQIGKIHNEENRNMDGAKRGFWPKRCFSNFVKITIPLISLIMFNK